MSNFQEVGFAALNGGAGRDGDGEDEVALQLSPTLIGFSAGQDASRDGGHGQSNATHDSAGASSVWGASFNFVNSIVGAGIIGIPFAIQQCGFVPGMILLLLVAFLINRSAVMLVDCGIRAHKLDYEALAEHLLGPPGYYMAVGSMLMFAYGGALAYLVILGDTLPKICDLLLGASFLSQRRAAIAFFSTTVVLPLCLLRDLSSLAWTSFASIFADAVLIAIVLAAAPSASQRQDEHFESADLAELSVSMFAGLGTMSFAFVCQHTSFLVFRSLRSPTLAEWRRVANLSLGLAYLLCLLLGLIGFFAFYPQLDSDLLNNFPADSPVVAVARGLLALTMLFTYPMECYVARHCLHSLTRRFAAQRAAGAAWRRRDRVVSRDEGSEAFWRTELGAAAAADDDEDAPRGWRGWWRRGPNPPWRWPFGAEGRGQGGSPGVQVVLSPLQSYGPAQASESPRGAISKALSLSRDHLQSREDLFEDVSLDLSRHSQHEAPPGSESLTQRLAALVALRPRSSGPPSAAPGSPASASSSSSSRRRRQYSGLPSQAPADSSHLSDTHQQLSLDNLSAFRDAEDERDGRQDQVLIDVVTDAPPPDAIGTGEHVFVTLALWLSTVAIALVVDKLGLVSSLTGVVAASSLGYILPALLYLKTHGPARAGMRPGAQLRRFGLALFMVAFGVVSFIVGTATVLAS